MAHVVGECLAAGLTGVSTAYDAGQAENPVTACAPAMSGGLGTPSARLLDVPSR